MEIIGFAIAGVACIVIIMIMSYFEARSDNDKNKEG